MWPYLRTSAITLHAELRIRKPAEIDLRFFSLSPPLSLKKPLRPGKVYESGAALAHLKPAQTEILRIPRLPGGTMNDIYRINVAKTDLREAYEAGDTETILSVFDRSGFTDMSYGCSSKFGQEAVEALRERHATLFSEYSVKLSIIIIDIVVIGDKAYDYGWHEFTLKPKNGGPPLRKRERYFELWTRKSSDSWKVSLHITNSDVREELAGHVSHWFLSEQNAPAIN